MKRHPERAWFDAQAWILRLVPSELRHVTVNKVEIFPVEFSESPMKLGDELRIGLF